MPTDKPKPPDRYPASWHNALTSGALFVTGKFHPVSQHETQAEALAQARKFRAFLKGLPAYPRHPTSLAMTGRKAQTSVIGLSQGCWVFRVSVVKDVTELIKEQLK